MEAVALVSIVILLCLNTAFIPAPMTVSLRNKFDNSYEMKLIGIHSAGQPISFYPSSVLNLINIHI